MPIQDTLKAIQQVYAQVRMLRLSLLGSLLLLIYPFSVRIFYLRVEVFVWLLLATVFYMGMVAWVVYQWQSRQAKIRHTFSFLKLCQVPADVQKQIAEKPDVVKQLPIVRYWQEVAGFSQNLAQNLHRLKHLKRAWLDYIVAQQWAYIFEQQHPFLSVSRKDLLLIHFVEGLGVLLVVSYGYLFQPFELGDLMKGQVGKDVGILACFIAFLVWTGWMFRMPKKIENGKESYRIALTAWTHSLFNPQHLLSKIEAQFQTQPLKAPLAVVAEAASSLVTVPVLEKNPSSVPQAELDPLRYLMAFEPDTLSFTSQKEWVQTNDREVLAHLLQQHVQETVAPSMPIGEPRTHTGWNTANWLEDRAPLPLEPQTVTDAPAKFPPFIPLDRIFS